MFSTTSTYWSAIETNPELHHCLIRPRISSAWTTWLSSVLQRLQQIVPIDTKRWPVTVQFAWRSIIQFNKHAQFPQRPWAGCYTLCHVLTFWTTSRFWETLQSSISDFINMGHTGPKWTTGLRTVSPPHPQYLLSYHWIPFSSFGRWNARTDTTSIMR
jgi:hypothetical protein